jgi:hypothetical protein
VVPVDSSPSILAVSLALQLAAAAKEQRLQESRRAVSWVVIAKRFWQLRSLSFRCADLAKVPEG